MTSPEPEGSTGSPSDEVMESRPRARGWNHRLGETVPALRHFIFPETDPGSHSFPGDPPRPSGRGEAGVVPVTSLNFLQRLFVPRVPRPSQPPAPSRPARACVRPPPVPSVRALLSVCSPGARPVLRPERCGADCAVALGRINGSVARLPAASAGGTLRQRQTSPAGGIGIHHTLTGAAASGSDVLKRDCVALGQQP